MDNLLDSQPKTGENAIIQFLTKDLRIINVVSKIMVCGTDRQMFILDWHFYLPNESSAWTWDR